MLAAFRQSSSVRWTFVLFIAMNLLGLPLLLGGSVLGFVVISGWGTVWSSCLWSVARAVPHGHAILLSQLAA